MKKNINYVSWKNDYRGFAAVTIILVYCYLLRIILISFYPFLADFTLPLSAHSEIRNISNIWDATILILIFSAGYFWAIVVQYLIHYSHRTKWRNRSSDYGIPFLLIMLLLIVSCIAGISIALLLFELGIGIQGVEPETALPFNLAGILIYLKNSVIPILLLACVFLFERSGRTFYSRLAAASLIFIGFLDMVLFDTRGAALRSFLYIVLLWWISRFKIRRSDNILIFIILIGLLLMIAMVTEIRLYGEILETLSFSMIFSSINFIMFRVTGAEHLVAVVGLHDPLHIEYLFDIVNSARGIPGYYTTDLLGVDYNLPQTFAPSGLGWLYILGGWVVLAFGGVLLGFLTIGVYNWIPRNLPLLGSAAKSLYIFTLAFMLSEGAIETPLISFILGYSTLWLLENFLKRMAGKRRLNTGVLLTRQSNIL